MPFVEYWTIVYGNNITLNVTEMVKGFTVTWCYYTSIVAALCCDLNVCVHMAGQRRWAQLAYSVFVAMPAFQ